MTKFTEDKSIGRGQSAMGLLRICFLTAATVGLWCAFLNAILLMKMNPSIIGLRGTPVLLLYILIISVSGCLLVGVIFWAVSIGYLAVRKTPRSRILLTRFLLWAAMTVCALILCVSTYYNPGLFSLRSSSGEYDASTLLFPLAVFVVGLAFSSIYFHLCARARAMRSTIAGLFFCSIVLIFAFASVVWPRQQSDPGWAFDEIRPILAADDSKEGEELDKRPKVVLIGLDGADWTIINKLVAENKLPNFSAMMEQGTRGDLKTLLPARSPEIWTTIATGMPPDRHGITGYVFKQFYRSGINLEQITHPGRTGFEAILDIADSIGLLENVPITSRMRQTPALWNMLSLFGKESVVIGWWASWPAEKIRGTVVTERVNYARNRDKYGVTNESAFLTYPDRFMSDIIPLVVQPEQITIKDVQRFLDVDENEAAEILATEFDNRKLKSELRYLLSQDLTFANIAEYCLDQSVQPDLFAVYLRGVDILSHCALQYSNLLHLSEAEPEEIRKYGNAIERYYVFTDAILGKLLDKTDYDSTVIVTSDHGFYRDEKGEYHHTYGPDGIFLAIGPNVPKGKRIADISVFDIAPTILYLLSLPVAEDMPGRIVWNCIRPALQSARAVEKIPTYGSRNPAAGAVGNRKVEDEMVEHLRALGYLD